MDGPCTLVIFDCDGVLIDSEVISASVLIEEAAAVGIALTRDDVRDHFLGRSFPTVAATIRAAFGDVLPEDFEARYRASLLARFESKGFADVVELMSLDVDLPPMFTVTGANAAASDEAAHLAYRSTIEVRKAVVRNTHLVGGYVAEVVTDPKTMLDEFTGKEHLRPQ